MATGRRALVRTFAGSVVLLLGLVASQPYETASRRKRRNKRKQREVTEVAEVAEANRRRDTCYARLFTSLCPPPTDAFRQICLKSVEPCCEHAWLSQSAFCTCVAGTFVTCPVL
jgi:hypothetical protein